MVPDFRVGYGFDIHQLKSGRPLILGGVTVPFEFGLDGHSDADVLTHAIIDALLGAAAMGDIGAHFPDTDPKYKGADSLELLKHCVRLLKNKGFDIGNIDATIVAQRPKLRTYIDQMRANISRNCELSVNRISIKATTSEKIGFVGREEGMSATAVCLIYK